MKESLLTEPPMPLSRPCEMAPDARRTAIMASLPPPRLSVPLLTREYFLHRAARVDRRQSENVT